MTANLKCSRKYLTFIEEKQKVAEELKYYEGSSEAIFDFANSSVQEFDIKGCYFQGR